MAGLHSPRRLAETFALVRYDLAHPDFVERVDFDACAVACASALAWSRAEMRRAEVWCGPWMVFDSDEFFEPSMGIQIPNAPGRYRVSIGDGDAITFTLIKRGLGW